MMHINPLTSAEETLMLTIWTKESFFLRELMEALPEPKPHQNTVSTYLKLLTEKHFLSVEKQGRIFSYKPVISQKDYRNYLLRNLLDKFHGGSAKEILKYLFEEKLITNEDLLSFYNIKIEVLPTSRELKKLEEETALEKKQKDKDKKRKKKKK